MLNPNGYSTKANAHRAGRAHLTEMPVGSYSVSEQNGRWYVVPTPAPTTRNTSTVENPVAVVWAVVAGMVTATRKAQVGACVAQGVNFYTARTQVQLARKYHNEHPTVAV